MKELLKALSEAKKEIGAISKDSKNPFFKSKYFDINQLLEHVEPLLEKHGLMILQPISENKVTTMIFCIKDGDSVQSEIDLPNIQDPQKLGSAITYYRRYTLASLLALQATDDDANLASKKKAALTQEGFNYLVTKGNKAEIESALSDRTVTSAMKNELERLLKTK